MELRQLKPAVAVRGPHHRNVASDPVEPDGTVHSPSLHRRPALQLHTKFDKERDSSLKVVDDDAHVVHQVTRHGGSPSSRSPSWPLVYLVPRSLSLFTVRAAQARTSRRSPRSTYDRGI